MGFGWGPESSGDARAVSVRRKSEARVGRAWIRATPRFHHTSLGCERELAAATRQRLQKFSTYEKFDLDEGPGGRAAEEDRPTTSECICLGSNHSWHQNREEWTPIRVLVSMLSKSEDDH